VAEGGESSYCSN